MIAKLVDKYDQKVHRLLEIIPGFLTWALFLSPIWLGLVAPRAVIFYVTFLTIFWTYLAARHTYGALMGYMKHKKEMGMSWWQECLQLNFAELPDKTTLPSSLEKTKHFILIPVVNEPEAVLEGSINSILNQTQPLSSMVLVYTMEEKFAEEVEKRIRGLLGKHIDRFEEVLFFTHPAGIPNEAVGVAGANRTWGAKHGVTHLQNTGRDARNYIFTTFDSDSVLDPQFLARLTHLYLTSDKRDHKFYSTAVHLFNNNIWQVPILMRIEANSVTLGSLSDWSVTEASLKDTFSCYSASLQTLIDANYWDVQYGVDDTLFYWRAFFVRDGDFTGAEHYIPYSADAVQASSAVKAHKSMYLQLRRWGWGVIALPISLKEFLRNKRIPMGKKLGWTFKHFERKVFMLSLVFLMTLGISLLTLVNRDARQISLVYTIPNILSVILTGALVLLIPVTILRSKIVIPWPKSWPLWRKMISILEGPMVVINLFTFSLIPFLDAQTRMMFGKKMKDLYHTPKMRG